MVTDQELAERLKQRGTELGFSLVGIAVAARPDTFDLFRDWLQQGFHGEMKYLPERESVYEDSSGVMPGVKTIIMAAMNYGPGRSAPKTETAGTGRIAAYAQGTADYHDVLRKKLKQLSTLLHEFRPGSRSRVTVDTAPLMEKDVARRAGLGWFGKNTMLINKYAGSYFFLGGILTDCTLPPDPRHDASHCGTCTRCLEACPTQAFTAPHVMDARRCISYLTIEMRGKPIPVELRPGMQDWLLGCDVCQQVCPWNHEATAPEVPEFQPSSITQRTATEFLLMNEEEFKETYRKTPLSRPGVTNMARNAAIVLGNQGEVNSVTPLGTALNSADPIVRGAAAWALGQIATDDAIKLLQQRREVETDSDVQDEIEAVLK
ncbi:MAG TPA: tRNA epoxyqueuosine(34) reductase QueG [Planctomicrobium sp.]|nr:tRNA epoxyqueuosine(34) reductase QueG [Planctomicrobium sp.]